MKIYIAGRVTGISRDQAERNFKRGEMLLRANNHEPVNPLDFTLPSMTQKEAMKFLLPLLLTCDGVLMLVDWEFSEGAKIEYHLAAYTDMTILMEEDFD